MVRAVIPTTILQRSLKRLTSRWALAIMLSGLMCGMALPLPAQSLIKRLDSLLSENYQKVKFDTAYIERPKSKWAIVTRLNLSGMAVETEGTDNGESFKSRIHAQRKATVSVGVSYQGILLSLSFNPAQLAGKYHDYELNVNCYRRNFGFDIIYHNAKNFSGHYDQEGHARIELPDDHLAVKTLNLNAYYAFNHRRFSYPAAFSQSYIQRRSAGSFLLAASLMNQHATLEWEPDQELKTFNIGIGAGYGYNFVPHKGWLLHLSLLPTLIVYSNSKFAIGDESTKQDYHFPEFIAVGRASVVKLWSKQYVGMSMVYNYSNIGDRDQLAVYNAKWRLRAFFGLRL